MQFLKGILNRLAILLEFFGFLWRQRLWWMIPMVAVTFLLGVLLVVGQSSALAPFIYTLF
jgi:Family of unknown function (DUF5989)